VKSFEEMELSREMVEAIKEKGFKNPTPIQEKAIPVLMNTDYDLVGQAKTGTGKTAAFGIPLLEKITPGSGVIHALILTPTRELALQVAGEIKSLTGKRKFRVIAVYGGQSIGRQIGEIKKGADIVVGTPGRIIDLLNRGKLDFSRISWLVLDEADEMLNMGFIDDVEEILKSTSENKRVLLFSATMPPRILGLARRYMGKYKFINISDGNSPSDLTAQYFYRVYSSEKPELLRRIIEKEEEFYALIFCNTKVEVDGLNRVLTDMGYSSEAIHGDFSQYQRERVMYKFRQKKVNILIATDVAARGIDIPDITHVVNYNVPYNPEVYIHRIGRTGRAGKGGVSITLVSPEEEAHFNFIRRVVKSDIVELDAPTVEEIQKVKKEKFEKELQQELENFEGSKYLDWATELLMIYDQEKIVAVLLEKLLGGSDKDYAPLKKVIIEKGKEVRMFAAIGRESGINSQELVEMIQKKVKIGPDEIKNIRIFDRFSFFSVPSYYADPIIKAFKKRGRSIFDRARGRR